MLQGVLKGLEQPEYIHVLINPLPVYGLAMGLVSLMIGLALRSREARTGALALILIAATSAWPVLHYGQQGYDRVKGMADSEGEKSLEEHMRRAEQLIFAFYALGAVALVSIGAEWKRPKPRSRLRSRHWCWPWSRSASGATSLTLADTSGTKSFASSQRPSSAATSIERETTQDERAATLRNRRAYPLSGDRDGHATILAAALDLVSQANVNVGTHAEQGGHDCAQAAPDDETKKPTC